MSKHTPGPWHVDQDGAGLSVRTSDEYDIRWFICEQPGDGDERANARLIAEAPAMYEALRLARYRMIDAIEDSGFSVAGPTMWGAEDGYPKWVASARSEIANIGAILDRIEG